MCTLGTDGLNEVHAIVYQQRHTGVLKGGDDGPTQRHDLVIGGQRVAQLHDGDSGADRGEHGCGHAELPTQGGIGHEIEGEIELWTNEHAQLTRTRSMR